MDCLHDRMDIDLKLTQGERNIRLSKLIAWPSEVHTTLGSKITDGLHDLRVHTPWWLAEDETSPQICLYQTQKLLQISLVSLSLRPHRALTLKACWTTCVNWSWLLRLMSGGLRLWRRNSSNMRAMRSRWKRPEGLEGGCPPSWLIIEQMVPTSKRFLLVFVCWFVLTRAMLVCF